MNTIPSYHFGSQLGTRRPYFIIFILGIATQSCHASHSQIIQPPKTTTDVLDDDDNNNDGDDSSSYTCTGPIQKHLKFRISTYNVASAGLPYDPSIYPPEPLAEAVCCDDDYYGYAEPRGFYSNPRVSFLDELDSSSTNVFYDPVCGIPLFEAPVGRSFDDFVAETEEHGWPSFRPEEIAVEGNVMLADDGRVVLSACGTRLGTLEPDEKGDRYCLDVACISGRPAAVVGGDEEGGGFWESFKRGYFRMAAAVPFVME